MASVNKEDIPVLSAFMPHFWNWTKKYYLPEEPDEWWQEMIAEGNLLVDTYQDPLCREMVVAVMEDMERRYHENEVAQKKTKEQR